MLTGAVYHHGDPSDVCHTASYHHTCGSLHRHHGEGKYVKPFTADYVPKLSANSLE